MSRGVDAWWDHGGTPAGVVDGLKQGINAVGDPVTYAPTYGSNPINYSDAHVDVTGAHGHSSYFDGAPLSNVVSAALGTP
jgi:hypothetical protein